MAHSQWQQTGNQFLKSLLNQDKNQINKNSNRIPTVAGSLLGPVDWTQWT